MLTDDQMRPATRHYRRIRNAEKRKANAQHRRMILNAKARWMRNTELETQRDAIDKEIAEYDEVIRVSLFELRRLGATR
jgi:hypothetical protein